MPYADPEVRRRKASEYSRKHYLAHKEEKREALTKWKAANPGKMNEYGRAWYRRNREAKLAKHRRWLGENREEHLERVHAARRRNPIGVVLSSVKRRAKKAGVGFNLTEDWFLAHYSQGCEITGWDFDPIGIGMRKGRRAPSPTEAHVDRIRPGGDYTMDNCRIVCSAYNVAKWCWSDADVLKMATALVERQKGMQNG